MDLDVDLLDNQKKTFHWIKMTSRATWRHFHPTKCLLFVFQEIITSTSISTNGMSGRSFARPISANCKPTTPFLIFDRYRLETRLSLPTRALSARRGRGGVVDVRTHANVYFLISVRPIFRKQENGSSLCRVINNIIPVCFGQYGIYWPEAFCNALASSGITKGYRSIFLRIALANRYDTYFPNSC